MAKNYNVSPTAFVKAWQTSEDSPQRSDRSCGCLAKSDLREPLSVQVHWHPSEETLEDPHQQA